MKVARQFIAWEPSSRPSGEESRHLRLNTSEVLLATVLLAIGYWLLAMRAAPAPSVPRKSRKARSLAGT